MIETHYKCSNPKCGAEDRDRSPNGGTPPAFLNCWKCKAGFGKDPDVMRAGGIGMFPVSQTTH